MPMATDRRAENMSEVESVTNRHHYDRWWKLRRLLIKSPAHRRFSNLADRWLRTSGDECMPSELTTAIASWWLYRTYELKKQPPPKLLDRWIKSAGEYHEARHAGWMNSLMRSKKYCYYCDFSWRVENLPVCTNCESFLMLCCDVDRFSLPQWRNDNEMCPHCAWGEIVG